MFDIDFDVSGVQRGCEEGNQLLRLHAIGGVERAAKEGVSAAQSSHRYKDRTGALTKSGKARVLRSSRNGAEAVMRWSKPYASFVNDGTKAHEIRPKLAADFVGPARPSQGRQKKGPARGFLRFQMGGRLVFARVVHHPGTDGYNFVDTATEKAEAVLSSEIEAGFRAAERALSR